MTTAARLLFGTAGVPHSSSGDSTLSGIDRAAALGLDCLEVEFVRGVKMEEVTTQAIRERAQARRIALSVHAPYYINLNSAEEGKRLASQKYLLSAARAARECAAQSVVFHAGHYGRSAPEEAYAVVKKELTEVLSILKSEHNPVSLRVETMGKKSQFGSLDEILFLCREVEGLKPCLDFAHIHAREGKGNTFADFDRTLRKLQKKLGEGALRDSHFHIAGVDFGERGEIKHLNLKESDFHYDDWIQALKEYGVAGMVICESPNLEEDALMLKKLYHSKK